MSKKTGLEAKETRMLLSRGFFNRRYIVRNTLAATVLVVFLVMAIGISAVVTGDAAMEEETTTEERLIETVANEETTSGTTESIKETAKVDATANAANEKNETKPDVKVTEDKNKEENERAEISTIDKDMVSNSKYAGRFIAIDSGINIRSGAGTDYDAIGYLENGMVGEFFGTEGEWSNIAVGDLTGYVSSQFILVGDDAAKYAEENNFDIDTLSYYGAVEATEEEESSEDTEEYIEDTEEDTEEYVEDSSEEDDIQAEPDDSEEEPEDNESSEEDEAQEPAEEVEVDTSEEPVEDSEEVTEEEPQEDGYGNISVETVNRGEFSLSDKDITLIAAIVALEAGSEPYDGQVAVANIVLNRLNTGIWGNTIEDVVYAQNQFDVAYWDSFSEYIEAGASGVALQATLDAVAGTNNIADYLSYRPTYLLDSIDADKYTIIGNHVFF